MSKLLHFSHTAVCTDVYVFEFCRIDTLKLQFKFEIKSRDH